jgi:predicted transposase/invertase (TIGR01784 family)
MSIGICPLVDFALKRLLGDEYHIAITIHFLNAILVGQPRIRSARILNPARNKKNAQGKLSVLDILAIDELGRRLNIEVQTSIPAGMAQRLTYYVCVTYVDQLQEGQQYTELRPSISICVLAGAMFSEVPQLHLEFRLREMSSGVILTNDVQVHILQLNHLQITEEMLYNATPIERWAWFLRNVENLSVEDVARLFPDPEFSEAAGVLQMIAQTPEELMEYRARLKYQRDEMARAEAIETAKLAHEAAMRDLEAATRAHEAATRAHEAAMQDLEAVTRAVETEKLALEARKQAVEAQKQTVEAEKQAVEAQKLAVETEKLAVEAAMRAAQEAARVTEVRAILRGQIILLQRLLKEPVSTDSEFAACSVEQLQTLADQLQQRVFNASPTN